MQTIAFVPARCGSQSIKLKNIRPFCGKPLIYWNLKALSDAREVDRIYVATDCDEIERAVEEMALPGVETYRRDAENATDTASTESVMLEFIEYAQLAKEVEFLLVQCTSPFTQRSDFSAAIQQFRTQELDSLLSCALIKRFFWNPDGTPINYDVYNRPRRQDFAGTYVENGAFYLSTVGKIQASSNRISGKIGVYEMPEYTSVELDEKDDWLIAEKLMRRHGLVPRESASSIKLVVSDVDGVLTDAGMYYDQKGENEWKKFNTHDGKGFELLRKAGLATAIITSENTRIVERRAQKLKVDYLRQGIKVKLPVLRAICEEAGVSLSETAYIGDDINDLDALSAVGLAACPANALPAVKAIDGILQLEVKGGEGAFRALSERILADR